MELEGKIALVTGAGGGGSGAQGRAIALALAVEGADVAANDINLELAEATASEVRALGRRSMAVKADVSVQGEVNQMVERIIRQCSSLLGIGQSKNDYRYYLRRLRRGTWRH